MFCLLGAQSHYRIGLDVRLNGNLTSAVFRPASFLVPREDDELVPKIRRTASALTEWPEVQHSFDLRGLRNDQCLPHIDLSQHVLRERNPSRDRMLMRRFNSHGEEKRHWAYNIGLHFVVSKPWHVIKLNDISPPRLDVICIHGLDAKNIASTKFTKAVIPRKAGLVPI